MIRMLSAAAVALATAAFAQAAQAEVTPDKAAFRELYKELVETNTTLSAGSCTLAAERMGARLKAAGFADKDVRILAPEDRPKDGNLVAVLHGANPKAKPILLLAHIDVVEAKREDWERDPFTLVEENGYFYGRGATDDKAMAAALTDTLIRYKTEGFKPRRDLKLALTCGEETPDTFNGVAWLIANHPDALSAEFALNEGAGGRVDASGKPVFLGIQAGEKVYQDFQLEVTNPGGHSSRPVKDNAIYHLAGAISRLAAYDFPVAINEATRGHFEQMAAIQGGQSAADLKAALTGDADAIARVAKDPSRNSMMRTTCVATMVDAGHAPNALPQRGPRQRQLPDPAGRKHRERQGPAGRGVRRSGRFGDDGGRAQPRDAAASPVRKDRRPRQDRGRPALAEPAFGAGHGHRRHRRPLHQRRRNADLRALGHARRRRRQRRPRSERAHPRQVAL